MSPPVSRSLPVDTLLHLTISDGPDELVRTASELDGDSHQMIRYLRREPASELLPLSAHEPILLELVTVRVSCRAYPDRIDVMVHVDVSP
jgi:hypothetical protein